MFKEVFSCKDSFYLIMEILEGGSLNDFLEQWEDGLDEKDCKIIIN